MVVTPQARGTKGNASAGAGMDVALRALTGRIRALEAQGLTHDSPKIAREAVKVTQLQADYLKVMGKEWVPPPPVLSGGARTPRVGGDGGAGGMRKKMLGSL